MYIKSPSTISNTRNETLISGTSGNDLITNSGDKVTISAGAGNDTISGSNDFGELMRFAANTGNNRIVNFKTNDTLEVTQGEATFETVGSSVVVTITGANNEVGKVTLGGAAGLHLIQDGKYIHADEVTDISNANDNTKIVGTAGKDYITNSGNNVTIQGSAGNDTVEGSHFGDLFQFASDQGENVVVNFDVNDTLQATAGKIASFNQIEGTNDVLVSLQGAKFSGTVTLLDAAGLNLKQNGAYLTVSGVNAINNTGNDVKVTGTAKADYIVNTGSNVTIQANAGADTIEGSDEYGEMFLFASNTGNNVIVNFHENDTLKSTAGQIVSVSTITGTDDVLVSLKGSAYSGTVTLQGVAGNRFTITDKNLVRMIDLSNTGSSSEMPAAEDGYWFLDDETTADTLGEVDAMLAEVDSDNALGKLNLDSDPNELLTSVGGTKFEQFATQSQRHAFKK